MAEILKSKRGKRKLAFSGYMYVFDKRSSSGNEIWRCEKRPQCSARLHMNENLQPVFYINEHNHDSDAAQVEVTKAYNSLKQRAEQTQEVTSQIVQQSVQPLSQAAQGSLLSQDAMKKVVRRIRNKAAAAPAAPNSLLTLAIPQEYQEFEIPGGQIEQFLLADSGPRNDRILIFGRNKYLDMATGSQHLYVDGTFKITPPLFAQVYIVLAERFDSVHPVVYALLPNKQRATYERFFTMLKQLRPNLNPDFISCDFEVGAIQAMEHCFPHSIATGCFFHLVKNFKKQIANENLTGRYNTEADFAHSTRLIPALVFVPPQDLNEALDELGATLPVDLQPILTWFESNYVGLPNRQRRGRRPPLFPPQLWSCYDRVINDQPCTNNFAEAAHRRLQTELGMHHPTIWKFIDGLRKVQVSRDVFYEHLLGGNSPPKKKKKYLDCDKRIKAIVSDYTNRTIAEYLHGLAHNFQMTT